MISNLFRALALLCLWSPLVQAAGIDFTPRNEITKEDGFTFTHLAFNSGNSKILLRPNRDWRISGAADQVTFESQKLRDCLASITNVSGPRPAEFNEEGLKFYRETAEHLLPKEAADAKELGEKQMPISVNEWRSYERTFSYKLGGRTLVRSLLFIKLDPQREIRVTIDSPEESFSSFSQTIYGGLSTWYETTK